MPLGSNNESFLAFIDHGLKKFLMALSMYVVEKVVTCWVEGSKCQEKTCGVIYEGLLNYI